MRVPFEPELRRRLTRLDASAPVAERVRSMLLECLRQRRLRLDLKRRLKWSTSTDGFLMATIIRGRAGAAMSSWGPGGAAQPPLAPQNVLDLVAFIRSWQRSPGEIAAEEVAEVRSENPSFD